MPLNPYDVYLENNTNLSLTYDSFKRYSTNSVKEGNARIFRDDETGLQDTTTQDVLVQGDVSAAVTEVSVQSTAVQSEIEAAQQAIMQDVTLSPEQKLKGIQVLENEQLLKDPDFRMRSDLINSERSNVKSQLDARIAEAGDSVLSRAAITADLLRNPDSIYNVDSTTNRARSLLQTMFVPGAVDMVGLNNALGYDVSLSQENFRKKLTQDITDAKNSGDIERANQIIQAFKDTAIASPWYKEDIYSQGVTGGTTIDFIFNYLDDILSVAGIGFGTRAVYRRLGNKSYQKGSNIVELKNLDESGYSPSAGRILDDESNESAQLMGTTKEEVLENHIPNPIDEVLQEQIGVPDIPVADLQTLQKRLNEKVADIYTLTKDQRASLFDTQAERDLIAQDIITTAPQYGNLTVLPSHSSWLPKGDSDSWDFNFVYGNVNSNHNLFDTIEEARLEGDRVFDGRDYDVIDITVKKHGEEFQGFALKYNSQENLNDYVAGSDKLLLGEASIRGGGGKFSRWKLDMNGALPKFVSDLVSAETSFGSRIKQELESFTKPLLDLHKKDKMAASRVVDKLQLAERVGNAENRNLRWDELKDLDNSELNAYYSYRAAQDAMYLINNDRYHKGLLRDGYKSNIVIKDVDGEEVFSSPAVVAKKEELDLPEGPDTRTFLDNETGGLVQLTRQEIDEIYENGGTAVKFRFAYKEVDGVTVDQAIVKSFDKTPMTPLPKRVLPYTPGYISRIYQDSYFVTKMVEFEENGVKIAREIVSHTAPTERAANDLIATKVAKGEGERSQYKAIRGTELDDRDRIVKETDILAAANKLIVGKRGEHLRTVGDVKADITAPLESQTIAISNTANAATMTNVVENFKQRWLNQYGDMAPKGPDGGARFPTSMDQINLQDVSDPKRNKQAVAWWDYINSWTKIQDPSASNWRILMENVANIIGGAGQNGWRINAARRILGLAEKSPFQRIKEFNFYHSIVMNPLRHFTLGIIQPTFLFGLEPKLVTSQRYWKEVGNVGYDAYRVLQDEKVDWKKSATKVGMPTEKYRQLVQGFVNTGLWTSVDVAEFYSRTVLDMADSIGESSAVRNTMYLPRKIYQTTELGRKYGVDLGEQLNQLMTYMIVKERYLRKNPASRLDSTKARTSITGDVKTLTITPQSTARFSYQEGWLMLPMQFTAVQHKAWLAMLGKNNALERGEAFRALVIPQFAMWGTSAFGLTQAVEWWNADSGYPIPPVLRPFLDGLVFDWALEEVLSLTTDREVNIDLGEGMAPGSGGPHAYLTFLGRLYQEGKLSPNMLGAFVPTMSKYYTIAKDVVSIMSDAAPLTAEDARRVFQEMLAPFAGANNLVKANIMLNSGLYTTADGTAIDLSTEYGSVEAFFQAIGIRPSDLRIKAELRLTAKDAKVEMRKLAKEVYKRQASLLNKSIQELQALKDTGKRREYLYETARLANAYATMTVDERYLPMLQDELSKIYEQQEGTTSFLTHWYVKHLLQPGVLEFGDQTVNFEKMKQVASKDEIRRLERFIEYAIARNDLFDKFNKESGKE